MYECKPREQQMKAVQWCGVVLATLEALPDEPQPRSSIYLAMQAQGEDAWTLSEAVESLLRASDFLTATAETLRLTPAGRKAGAVINAALKSKEDES